MTKLQINCCICMRPEEKLTNLMVNEDENSDVRYIDMLNYCVPTNEIWKEYYQICEVCITQLTVAYSFLRLCSESEFFRKHNLNDENILKEPESSKTIKYTCDNCGKSFKEKKSLSLHITKVHVNKKHSNKNTKEEKQSSRRSLAVTTGQQHDIKLEENSDESEPASVEEKVDLNSYCETEIKEQDSGCTSDSETEIDKKTISKKKRKQKGPLNCDFCNTLFEKRKDWLLHVRTQHKFEKPFACNQCDVRYMNSYSLFIHKRKHTNEKPYICATCGKSFRSSADLNHHVKTHNVVRAYPCPLCDRRFKTHSNLRTHKLQMHLDPAEWKFPCNMCDKKFPIRSNLIKHLQRHTGVKEFICQICEKKFLNKAELKVHFNTHTNQRYYKCTLCIKEYKNREGLRRHMKVVHDLGNWKPSKTDNVHPCPTCAKVFPYIHKLRRHMFTHTGEKRFKCEYCPRGFMDNYRRELHYKKEHIF